MPETTLSTPPTTPTRTSSTAIALLVSALTGLPPLLQSSQALDLGMPVHVRNALAVISVVALWLAPLLARHSATVAVQKVEAVAEVAKERADVAEVKADAAGIQAEVTAARVEEVASVTADALDPHTETPENAVDVLRGE